MWAIKDCHVRERDASHDRSAKPPPPTGGTRRHGIGPNGSGNKERSRPGVRWLDTAPHSVRQGRSECLRTHLVPAEFCVSILTTTSFSGSKINCRNEWRAASSRSTPRKTKPSEWSAPRVAVSQAQFRAVSRRLTIPNRLRLPLPEARMPTPLRRRHSPERKG